MHTTIFFFKLLLSSLDRTLLGGLAGRMDLDCLGARWEPVVGCCVVLGKHWDICIGPAQPLGFYFSTRDLGFMLRTGRYPAIIRFLAAAGCVCVEPLNAEPQVHCGHTRKERTSVAEGMLSL